MKIQGFQGQMPLLKCKVLAQIGSKSLHFLLAQLAEPTELCIVSVNKLHKKRLEKPFLWNCAAVDAWINWNAAYSVDIMYKVGIEGMAIFKRETL